MKKNEAVNGNGNKVVVPKADEAPEKLHTTDSIYRGIVLACLRSKQLIKGATPRINANPAKRKNTSIAIEEIRLGLINFEILPEELK